MVDKTATDKIVSDLAACIDVGPDLLQAVAEALRECVGATGVYIAERLAVKGAEDGGSGWVKYVAASNGHEFMLGSALKEGEGITFKAWVMPEAATATEEDSGAVPSAPPVLPTLHVPNVLRSGEVHFFRLPRPGAFLVAPLQYGSVLHESGLPAIDAAALTAAEAAASDTSAAAAGGDEDQEGGEAAPADAADAAVELAPSIPPGNPLPRSLAVCADTLGQNRDFSPAQVAAVQSVASALKGALLRVEAAAYALEYEAARKYVAEDADAGIASTRERLKEATSGARTPEGLRLARGGSSLPPWPIL